MIALMAILTLVVSGCSGVKPLTSKAAGASQSASAPSEPASGDGCATNAGTGDQIQGMSELLLSDALAKMPGTTKFAAYLKGNEALAKSLDKAGNYTIFVPVDAAFAKLLPEQLTAIDTNVTLRDSVLMYAVAAVPVAPSKIRDSQQLPTLNGSDSILTLTKSDTTLQLNGASSALCRNISTARTTIYLTDTVLYPTA